MKTSANKTHILIKLNTDKLDRVIGRMIKLSSVIEIYLLVFDRDENGIKLKRLDYAT